MKGITTKTNEKNGFRVILLHYTADPNKRSEEWKKRAQEGITPQKWQSEYELNFDITLGERVYPQFTRDQHIKKLIYNKKYPIIRGWDFGFHRPVVIFSQLGRNWYVLKEIIGHDVLIHDFCDYALEKTKEWFPDVVDFEDYCDLAGTQVSDKSEQTSIQVLVSKGVYPMYQKLGVRTGVTYIQWMLAKERMVVDESCEVLIQGFLGGYVYPKKREGLPEAEIPYKDGFYDNAQDGLRMSVHNKLYVEIEKKQSQSTEDLLQKLALGLPVFPSNWYNTRSSIERKRLR